MKKNFLFLYLLIGVFLSGCTQYNSKTYYRISGFAQGTSYHMTYAVEDSIDLQEKVDSILDDFDMSMSTYLENSIISKLNRNEIDSVDEKFKKVFEVASEVYRNSNGAFDLTVMPLVNAWGFGPGKKTHLEQNMLDSILQLVGMSKIKLEGDRLVKENPGITIDVNAIAQGYSVDIIAEYFESLGITDYMVEIGGEIKAIGKNPKGEKWKIGVDRPEYGNFIPGADMQVILEISGKSLATSGNYRKFYEEDGIKYSHSINPETGMPVRHEVLSTTIIMDKCINADAYATACMVLGLEKSKKMIESVKGLEAYIIYADEAGLYQVYYTKGFKPFIYKDL